ncbi:homeobox protein DTH-1-like [Astyanax mexicanus]|uniref:Homeobox protein DTH-1-like n=1 Tax=Astyanax mexicanus TaxID=7994 RepID=A0A8T2L0H0_ASTMX|nr:homeobox protein DTH-1-like [Astyanax mexicanus]
MGKTNLTLKILLIFTLYLISGGGASNKVRGYSGGEVLIKCKYDQEYTSNNKYFCKDSWPNCGDLIKTEIKDEWVNTGRFSLIDNTSSAEFWVIIRELTVEDSGRYQCGVDIILSKDIYTPVELKIHEEPTVKPSASPSTSSKPGTTEATTSSTSTPTVTSAYNTSPGLSPEKNVSQSSTSTSSLTTLHTSKTTLSSSSPTTGEPSSSPVISVVAVILLLVLIGLLFFIVALRKKRNPQATSPDQTFSDSSNNRRVSHTVYDYEEIKATGRHPTPDTGASTVYSTAQLPTNPSDPSDTLYHNVQLRTGLGDFSNPIYSTAQDPQLPTSPSDSSVSDLQRKSVQPAEDPAYATVKFTKNDAVTIATINKEEEDSCDYATVK